LYDYVRYRIRKIKRFLFLKNR